MQTKMPVTGREYELPLSDDEYEDDVASEEVKEISIEGYKLIFDKKVMVIPTEVITINQSQV